MSCILKHKESINNFKEDLKTTGNIQYESSSKFSSQNEGQVDIISEKWNNALGFLNLTGNVLTKLGNKVYQINQDVFNKIDNKRKELGIYESRLSLSDYLKKQDTSNKINIEVQQTPVIKEGVPELFKENPELASIGTPEQYSQYLDTIFPDSKMKDIVYHGSFYTFDKFSKETKNRTQITSELGRKAFYFSNDKDTAKSYLYDIDNNLLKLAKDLLDYYKTPTGKKFQEDLKRYDELSKKDFNSLTDNEIGFITDAEYFDIQNRVNDFQNNYPSYLLKYLPLNPNNIDELEQFIKNYKVLNKSKLYNVILNIENPVIETNINIRTNVSNLIRYSKNNLLSGDSIIFENVYEGITDKYGLEQGSLQSTTYAVFEPEQIHILSSKKDLEMFRNFINFTKSEYAKYGDIQQFKDYIMSKNFAAIEEFLVVNNKIDRKC